MVCKKCKSLKDIENLSYPYLVRECKSCGRKIKLRETGKDGRGLLPKQGDSLVIPEGFIQVSANPLVGNSHLFRSGIEFLAKLVFVDDLQNKKDKILDEIKNTQIVYEQIIRKSPLFAEIDFENEEERVQIVIQKLNELNCGIEWWALLYGIFTSIAQDAINSNDIKQAVWAMACAERFRTMVVFKQEFEDAVWMGQSTRKIINLIRSWNANQENSKEEFWQGIFSQNPYTLSQIFSVPVVFIQDKAYVGGQTIDGKGEKFVDFLYASESSRDVILVEIKTPVAKLLGVKYRDLYTPSKDLSGSIVQALNYRREISKNIIHLTHASSKKIDVFNPRCVVIIGNAKKELDDDIKKKSFELYRGGLKDVEIITFDELFRKAVILAELFDLEV